MDSTWVWVCVSVLVHVPGGMCMVYVHPQKRADADVAMLLAHTRVMPVT